MCARYHVISPIHELTDLLDAPFTLPTGWLAGDILPSNLAPVGLQGGWTTMKWGFVPPWVEDPVKAKIFINARSETVAELPSFRQAFRATRCIVPADLFYEWKEVPVGTPSLFGGPADRYEKQLMSFRMTSGRPFAMAGIYTQSKGGDRFAVLTCDPNALLGTIHDRMPCILNPDQLPAWLDPQTPREELERLLTPYPASEMVGADVG